jgi:prephenate dehydrogenase
LANRPALLTELRTYQATLQHLEHLLKADDGEALAAFFGRARAAREHWAPGRPPFSRTHEGNDGFS